MSEIIEARVARLEEAVVSIRDLFRDDRTDAREDRKEIVKRLDQLQQSVQSTGELVSKISFEKCGERLDEHDKQMAEMKTRISDIEKEQVAGNGRDLEGRMSRIEQEFKFGKWLLGGGIHAVWKVAGLLATAGAFGGVVSYFAQHVHFS